jgi:hypothetical protein
LIKLEALWLKESHYEFLLLLLENRDCRWQDELVLSKPSKGRVSQDIDGLIRDWWNEVDYPQFVIFKHRSRP